MITEKKILVNNVLINYKISEVENSIANILILHGWRSSSDVFTDLINFLNKNQYSVLVPDLPAFGKSEIPSEKFDNEYLKDSVLELTEKINFRPSIIFGHSNGGAISTKIILSEKLNIKKLVLICSAGIRDKRAKKIILKNVSKIVKPLFKPKFMQGLRKQIYKMLNSSDYLESSYIQESYKNVIEEDFTEQFKQLKVSTQIIWGQNDKETPLYYAELLNKYIKNSKLEIITDSAHFPFLERIDEFNSILIKFLKDE